MNPATTKPQIFEIQRSADGKQFATLTTLNVSDKQFVDVTPVSGKWYYRIKVMDTDGKSAYSNTLVVATSKCLNNSSSVFPNPASNQLQVVLQGNSVENTYELFDALGRVILKGLLNANTKNSIDVSAMKQGLYVLKIITDADSKMYPVQIVK